MVPADCSVHLRSASRSYFPPAQPGVVFLLDTRADTDVPAPMSLLVVESARAGGLKVFAYHAADARMQVSQKYGQWLRHTAWVFAGVRPKWSRTMMVRHRSALVLHFVACMHADKLYLSCCIGTTHQLIMALC